MIKAKSLEIREIEYRYDKSPKISGMDDVIKAVKPMISDASKEFLVTLFLNIIRQEIYRIRLYRNSILRGNFASLHIYQITQAKFWRKR
jgi:hypothetical protein